LKPAPFYSSRPWSPRRPPKNHEKGERASRAPDVAPASRPNSGSPVPYGDRKPLGPAGGTPALHGPAGPNRASPNRASGTPALHACGGTHGKPGQAPAVQGGIFRAEVAEIIRFRGPIEASPFL